MKTSLLAALILFARPLPAAETPLEDPFPGRASAQPDVAIDPAGHVLVVAVSEGRLVFRARSAGGSFGPVTEVHPELAVPSGMRRGPRIAAVKDAIVITTPTLEPAPWVNDLVAMRSTDGGRSWSSPLAIDDARGKAIQLLHDLAVLSDGTLVAAWLDERAVKDKEEVFVARSTDEGRSWSKNARAYASPDGSVCECCPVWLSPGPGKEVALAFRNSMGGARDPYVVRSTNGGVTFGRPLKLGAATWRIQACPMAGSAGLFDDRGSPLHVVSEDGQLTLVRADGTEVDLGFGANPALVAAEGAVVLSYHAARFEGLAVGILDSTTGALCRLGIPAAPRLFSRDFPSLAARGRNVLLAFEERGDDPFPHARLASFDLGPPKSSPNR